MKSFFFFLFGFYTCLCFSQDVRVVDSLLKTPIENVNFKSNNFGVSTNKNGLVDVSVFKKTDTIVVSHLSYHSKKLVSSEFSAILFLAPRIKILPTIDFSEDKTSLLAIQIVCENKTVPEKKVNKSIANILEGNAGITLQESQSGGGSLNFRGMEANRLLLVVDGIPLNNTIYRSGHLQSSATINPFFVKHVNLLSAPASVAYGNGAMGGALLFNTMSNSLNENAIYFHQQYESSTNAILFNFLSNYHNKKLAFTTGLSFKSVGNLKMGGNRFHGYDNWGKEPFATIGEEQLSTSFSQADFMHKTIYSINDLNTLSLNTQYSTSSNISRFDKLNDEEMGEQKYAKWYYGPQNRFLQSISWGNKNPKKAYDNFMAIVAYQDVGESRHHKKNGELLLSNRYENVKLYDFMLDFNKQVLNVKLIYGVGGRWQKVNSTANFSDNKNTYYNLSRYPDGGSDVTDYFAYSQAEIPLSKKMEILLGGRVNQNTLKTNFNNITFSFQEVDTKNFSFIKSALIAYKITEKSTIKSSYYNGFRNPNIDDIGKVFSKNDKDVIVPNDKLEPEYSDNLELTLNYQCRKLHLQIQLYKIKIRNTINREYGTLNGVDSIFFDGEMMRIQMNKNIASSTIDGISFYGKYRPNYHFSISANCNYLKGETAENKPLAHIPPINTNLTFNYIIKQHEFELSCKYSAWKFAANYDKEGVDNLEEATKDGSPMWYTLNTYYSCKIDESFTFGIGLENIFDVHYKTFASGISASGRNLILSLSSNF